MQSVEQESLVNNVERRSTIERNSLSPQRLSNLESAEDQTWQGRIIFIVLLILRVLERQSYLLSIIAML
ncbi:unnamed protein product, partial [Adineta steineri]